MEQRWRRRRLWLLKPLLSASLLLATLLTIHRLRVAETDALGVRRASQALWCGSQCFSFKRRLAKNSSASPATPAARGGPSEERAPGRSAPAAWDAQVLNCSEDASVRTQDWFRRLDPRFHQFVLRRHCRYFPMLINHPERCAGGEVHLLMVVKSVIEQHDRREAVRQTWGQEQSVGGRKTRTLFLLGSPATGKDAKNLQKLIEYEDRLYGDILQWDFMDTFFNLTLKEVNFLKWFDTYCPGVRFVFKGDDDVFVNTRNLLELTAFRAEERREAALFVGDTISKAVPIRNRQSKYYIPKELHDQPYPPYAGGGGFLMSAPLARRLFAASQGVQLYPIDDVFLGMCLQKLRLVPEMHPGFRTFGISRRRASPMNSEPCFYRSLIVVHKLSAPELLRMWREVHSEGLVCAQKSSIWTDPSRRVAPER